MRFRTGLMFVSFASVAAGGAFVACGGSTSTPGGNDAGTHDARTSHDTGTNHDTGMASHDTGTNHDTGTSHDTGASHDAGTHDTGVDSGGSVPFDAGAPTEADLAACQASSTSLCNLHSTCENPTFLGDYGDGGNCLKRESISCVAALQVPGTAASPTHTTSCATAQSTESCTDYLNQNPPAACSQVAGTGVTGAPCSHPAQCTSGFCAIAPQTSCGTCQAAPAAGASCTELDTCGPTLTCSKGTCIALAALNAPCSATQLCGAGLSCVLGTVNECKTAGITVGATCDPAQTTGPGCDTNLGLYCSNTAGATNKTCQAVATAVAGGQCGKVAGVETICTALSTCDKQPGDGGIDKCIARAADNAACDTVGGPACQPPSRCIGAAIDGGTSGTCILPGTFTCQ